METLKLGDVRFEENQADFGGAVYSKNSTVRIDNTHFDENIGAKGGGAIYLDGGNLISRNTSFRGNQADFGGAIFRRQKTHY